MRSKRRAVTSEERMRASEIICKQLIDRDFLGPVAVYLAFADEIDLSAFIESALARGVKLLAPRWTGSTYVLAPLKGLDAESLRVGPMGISEPADPPDDDNLKPTTWLVPGLAFTSDGRRVGYGGGWYDRLMADADASAMKIGIAYGFQMVDNLPSDLHDVRLTEVVHQ